MVDYLLINPLKLDEKGAKLVNAFLKNPRTSVQAKRGNRSPYLIYVDDIPYEFDFYISNQYSLRLIFENEQYLLVDTKLGPIASLQAGDPKPVFNWFENSPIQSQKPNSANEPTTIDLLNLDERTSTIIHTYLKKNPHNKIRRSKPKTNKNKNDERIYQVEIANQLQEFKLLENQRLIPYKDNEYLLIDDEKIGTGGYGKIFFPKAIIKVEANKITVNVEEAQKLIVKIPQKHDYSKINSVDEIPIVKEVKKAAKAYADEKDLPKACFNSYQKNGKPIYYAILPRFGVVTLYSILWGNQFSNLTYQQKRDLILRPLWKKITNLHAKGIVHNDFTPVNIMVDGKGAVNLIDFGQSLEASEFKNLEEFKSAKDYELQCAMLNCYDLFNLKSHPLHSFQRFCSEYFNTKPQPNCDEFIQLLETHYRKELNFQKPKDEILVEPVAKAAPINPARDFCSELQKAIFKTDFKVFKGNTVYLHDGQHKKLSDDREVPKGIKSILTLIDHAKQIENKNPGNLALQQRIWEQTIADIKKVAFDHGSYNPVKKFFIGQHTETQNFYKKIVADLEGQQFLSHAQPNISNGMK